MAMVSLRPLLEEVEVDHLKSIFLVNRMLELERLHSVEKHHLYITISNGQVSTAVL